MLKSFVALCAVTLLSPSSASSVRSSPQSTHRRTQRGADIDLQNCNVTKSEFNITIVDMSDTDIDPRFERTFNWAARRWELIIVGDLPGFPAGTVDDWFNGAFSRPFSGPVDDLVIGFSLTDIDGPGGTLGRAGGAFFRTGRDGVPTSTISGIMEFDIRDMERMDQTEVRSVVLHEMGHVLGLVGTTGSCAAGCDRNNANVNAPYQCERAKEEFLAISPDRRELVLENNGGPGTACGHWEEDIFRTEESSELMTGFFEANLLQPISIATVAALEDIGGYEVDYCGADVWPARSDIENKYEVLLPQRDITVDTTPTLAPRRGIDEDGRETPLSTSFASVASMVTSFLLSTTAFLLL